MNGYAVIPDSGTLPAAVFDTLEDALEWALDKYGSDAFRIKYVAALLETDLKPRPRALAS